MQWCRANGADKIIDHHKPFAEEFKRIGADGPLTAENLRKAHGKIESGSMIGKRFCPR